MGARSTEIMVRKFLIEELQARDIKISEHPSYSTPKGRKEPDILLQNGGEYIVETKLGGDLFVAVSELYDYLKYIKVSGGFAVILPEELRTSVPIDWLRKMANSPKLKYSVMGMFNDARPIIQLQGTLNEVSDWISLQVLKPTEIIEVDTSLIINVLRNAVSYISASTKKLKKSDLETIFGGKSVFANILQYEEKKYPIKEMQEATAYLLINQIMFYHVLSFVDPIEFKPIDEDILKHSADLNKYFNKVLEVDYTPVFGFDVASNLPKEVVPTLQNVIGVTKAIGPEKIGYDILGKIFHDLIPFEVRKAVAAFYTNNEAADLLANLAIDNPEDKVIDLAVGSGTLLVSAYKRKRALLPSFGADNHRTFLSEEITGIDIMPFAAHLAVVHLALQAPQYTTDKVRVAVWDSITLKPGIQIPAIARELKDAYKHPTLDMYMDGKQELGEEAYMDKGIISSEVYKKESIPLESVDVTIMNPPFTRQERLPKKYKAEINKYLKHYKKYSHGQMGFYANFIFLADKFLKENGRMAFVLPATILRIQSTIGIRRFISNNYEIEFIITTNKKSAFSESARFREILLIAKKTKQVSPKTKCLVVTLKSLPKDGQESIRIAVQLKKIRKNKSLDYSKENADFSLSVITQQKLKKSVDNMFSFIACSDFNLNALWDKIESKSENKLKIFSEILKNNKGEILRGVETKSMLGIPFHSTFICKDISRAIKKTDAWIVHKRKKTNIEAKNKYTKEIISIPFTSTENGIRRASGVDKIDITNSQDFIVVKKFPDLERLLKGQSVKKFLKGSKYWHKYVKSRQSNFLINRRYDISAKNTNLIACYSDVPTTGMNLWSVYGLSKDEAKILALWYNSSINILQIILERIEARGAWITMHEYVIMNAKSLNVKALNKKEKSSLLKIYDNIKEETYPSILSQLQGNSKVRQKIDKAILKVLGFNNNEIKDILNQLIPSLTKEIEQLKLLMKEIA